MDLTADARQADLRHYLHVVVSRRILVAVVALGMMAAALVASLLQTAVYEASAEILLQPRASGSIFGSGGGGSEPATVETEVRVISSDPVRSRVSGELGSAPPISASRVDETEVMSVQAHSTDAGEAARIANVYAEAYIDVRREQAVSEVVGAGEAIQQKIDAIQPQIEALDAQISVAPAAERADVEARVRPRYTSLVTQQGSLQQTLNQLQVDVGLKTGGAQLVRAADTPRAPVKPKPARNALAALASGLVVGVALALLRDHLDDSIKTREDLGRLGGGLLVLGVIPVIRDLLKAGDPRPRPLPQSAGGFNSPAVEAYRSLRTSVQLLGVDRPLRTIQVTSPMAGDGKTSTVVNLATVLAAAGERVVMVDCDLRRPRLHEIFEVANTVGFTSLFLSEVTLAEATCPVPGEERLFLLPSGRIPANPSEVLASKRTSALLFELQQEFDIVLVDSAPILPVTDATVLTAWVEATLIVTRAGVTTRKQVSDALALLRQVDASVAGMVLNQAAEEASYGYGYGHGYGENGQRADADGDLRRRRSRRARAPAEVRPS
ncbi:MAG: polysaccharide biosynthesis tyrosine autokinase [Acidimicrobiales bacterium]